ncbi:MAG: hypothetical protein IJJ34_05285 [Clostridia bacterium]|nr:hypothetical protein [Clostridia bacterium]
MSIRRGACLAAAILLVVSLAGCMFVSRPAPQRTEETAVQTPAATQEKEEQVKPEKTETAQVTEKPEESEKPESTQQASESGSSASSPTPSATPQGGTLDSNTQYEANIFLSNFAEQYWYSYDRSAEDYCQWAHFAILFAKINRHSDIEYKQWYGEPYETLTLAQIDEITYRYLGVHFGEDEANEVDGWDHLVFREGRVGSEAADGELHNLFVVVDSIKDDGGLKVATFTVYSTDDLNSDCYKLTPGQAMASSSLTKEGTGTAVMKPYSVNGRSTYQLLRYQID